MNYIRLTKENLDSEHICCAISSNKDPQVMSKKVWLRERLDEGLVFLKADARGKCFIEYIPAEAAWAPIAADGYLYIDCFWVSGSLQGHGYADELLNQCVQDAKTAKKKGICVLSSPKKKSFLSDPQYLKHRGFQVADSAEPYFELLYLPLAADAKPPVFLPQAKTANCGKKGLTLYYSSQCPFTAKYVPLLAAAAKERQIPLELIHFESAAQVKASPAVFSVFSLFYDGKFLTHEIQSEKKFAALCDTLGKA